MFANLAALLEGYCNHEVAEVANADQAQTRLVELCPRTDRPCEKSEKAPVYALKPRGPIGSSHCDRSPSEVSDGKMSPRSRDRQANH